MISFINRTLSSVLKAVLSLKTDVLFPNHICIGMKDSRKAMPKNAATPISRYMR
jgi:hypothetical protein